MFGLHSEIGQMKTSEAHVLLLVFVAISTFEFVRVSGSASCNPAVLQLYGWCEQWACSDNCTCMERPDCRQYCDGHTCKDMRCLSPRTCKQKVHQNGSIRPHVLNMFARAPFVTQDCSGGTCDVMRAKGPKRHKRAKKQRRRSGKRNEKRRIRAVDSEKETASNAALQNCVEGRCRRLISTLKISKQFCSHCTKMHCFGAHATNCTQICAIGECKHVQCDAEDCQQACLQNSTCSLKCGKKVKTCFQVCELGSTCEMKCEAENCRQVCLREKDCKILKKASISTTTSNGNSRSTTTSQTPTTTTETTTTTTSAATTASTHAYEYTSKNYNEFANEKTSKKDFKTSKPMILSSTTAKTLTLVFEETLKNTSYSNSSVVKTDSLNLSSKNSAIRLKLANLPMYVLVSGWLLVPWLI